MKLRNCMLLLPGYELDGFPRTATTKQAEELLSGWVAMWHPAIILASNGIPKWQQVEHPPSELEGHLFVLPSLAVETIPDGFQKSVDDSGGRIIHAFAPWRELQTQLLQTIASGEPIVQQAITVSDNDLLDHFAALGYIYLQIQLMTRQLRYSSSLDIPLLEVQVTDASRAAASGDREEAMRMLQAAFDSIGQERDHYYSLDVHLVDLTLLAPSTLGKSLGWQIKDATNHPTNFIASGSLLEQLAAKSPDRLAAFKSCIEAKSASLAGGLYDERPHALLTRESLVDDLRAGRRAYESLGIQPPDVFARLSYGQMPTGSSIQKRSGFEGTLLLSFADGSYPSGNQAKVSWEAPDGTFINGLSGTVFDASDPASFLALGWEVGDALDHQHVPTIIFAHWPARLCEYHRLMQIISKCTPALGRWTTLDAYFGETDQPYHHERFDASKFRSNWLAATDQPHELLTALKQYHILDARLTSLRNLATLAWQLENRPKKNAARRENANENADNPAPPDIRGLPESEWAPELAKLRERCDEIVTFPDVKSTDVASMHAMVEAASKHLTERLAKCLIGKQSVESKESCGRLVLNPYCCPVRAITSLDADQTLAPAGFVFADGRAGNARVVSLDIPSVGFAVSPVIPASGNPTAAMPLAEVGGLLRNEFLEAQVDTQKGHLRSLHAPGRRGNRLSLQIARRSNATGEYQHSQMHATDVRMLTSSNMNGTIRAMGTLMENTQLVANFQIDYEVHRGSRILEIDIRLSNLNFRNDEHNPWRNAFVIRVAWATEAARMNAYSAAGRHEWTSGKAIAPQLIHIDESEYHTHYLTGGAVFHRRMGDRFLESVIAAPGHTEMRHRIGIGVDLPHPIQAAARFLDREYHVDVGLADSAEAANGWLMTVDVATVDANLRCPLVDSDGNNIGIRITVAELRGRSTRATIRLLRNVRAATRIDYLGNKMSELTVADDAVTVPLRANEHTYIDVLWE